MEAKYTNRFKSLLSPNYSIFDVELIRCPTIMPPTTPMTVSTGKIKKYWSMTKPKPPNTAIKIMPKMIRRIPNHVNHVPNSNRGSMKLGL